MRLLIAAMAVAFLWIVMPPCVAQAQSDAGKAEFAKKLSDAQMGADTAWMLVATGLVMLMVPGLALFYGGMVRRKNVLTTMMQSMVALAIVGVYWIAIGYSLAFGDPLIRISGGSFLGFNSELLFLHGVKPDTILPGTNIPVFVHVMFQGMFAIITPALISGAIAERVRFGPYCLFTILWVTFVYCPLAHCVWALDWNWHNTLSAVPDAAILDASGKSPIGWLGAMKALDFAGGTVVHIAAGFSGLAAILVLRKRLGYPGHTMHPNSIVLTLTGAGLLWFGWFGFNGGSAGGSGTLASSAFAVTQAGAAAAGLSWLVIEWLHRGKPTALGLASGVVAGLVAVTPAAGFVHPWAGLVIGGIAGAVCYAAVALKPKLGYDDSLDAFGVHGVGGFLGALLTGVFCLVAVNSSGADGVLAGNSKQFVIQAIAAVASAVFAFGISIFLVKLVDIVLGFTAMEKNEVDGLDRSEHGEVGFDLGLAMEAASANAAAEPRAATVPPSADSRFKIVLEGAGSRELMDAWSDFCQPQTEKPLPEFKAIYPQMTTVQGNTFRFRGGDPALTRDNLQRLFESRLQKPVKARIES
jgi:ammonium transporter